MATLKGYSPVLTNNSQKDLNGSNVGPVLNQTKQAIQNSGQNLNSEDIFHISLILKNAANVSNLSNQDFQTFAAIVDLTLNLESPKFGTSQNDHLSSQRILQALMFMPLNLQPQRSDYLENAQNMAFTTQNNICQNNRTDPILTGLMETAGQGRFQRVENGQSINSGSVSASISLPTSVSCSSKGQRVNFAIFNNLNLFTASANANKVSEKTNSERDDACTKRNVPTVNRAVSAAIGANKSIFVGQLLQPVSLNFKSDPNYEKPLHSSQYQAGFWTFSNWSTQGCSSSGRNNDVYGFQCTHLTDFTLLVTTKSMDPSLCEKPLAITGYVLSGISTFSLGLLIAVLLISGIRTNNGSRTHLKSGENAVTLMFVSTLFLFFLLFTILADSSDVSLNTSNCNIVAAVLYTLLLSSMLYTGFQALVYFRRSYDLFNKTTWLRIATNPWFILTFCSAIPVILCIAMWFGTDDFFKRLDYFCWIRPNYVIYGIVIPLGILIVADIVVTLVTSKRIFFKNQDKSGMYLKTKMSEAARKKIFWRKVTLLLCMQFTLGLPWVFQFFTIGTPSLIPMHYVFTIFNASQGLILAILFFLSKFTDIKKGFTSRRVAHTSVDRATTSNGHAGPMHGPNGHGPDLGETEEMHISSAQPWNQERIGHPRRSSAHGVLLQVQSQEEPNNQEAQTPEPCAKAQQQPMAQQQANAIALASSNAKQPRRPVKVKTKDGRELAFNFWREASSSGSSSSSSVASKSSSERSLFILGDESTIGRSTIAPLPTSPKLQKVPQNIQHPQIPMPSQPVPSAQPVIINRETLFRRPKDSEMQADQWLFSKSDDSLVPKQSPAQKHPEYPEALFDQSPRKGLKLVPKRSMYLPETSQSDVVLPGETPLETSAKKSRSYDILDESRNEF